MSGAEYRFDVDDPGMRRLFGVRYLIRDASSSPPDGAIETARRGRFVLYRFDDVSYVTVVDTIAPIAADRLNLGIQTSWVLSSELPELGMLPTVAFGGRAPAPPTLGPNEMPRDPPGEVLEVKAGPSDGVFIADVSMDRRAVVLLAASFDPRWEVRVDGVEASPEMVAPALVGVAVGPGSHQVLFSYRPFPWYGLLFLGAALVLGALAAGERLARRDR
jgi:hypothetical protein